MRSIVCAVALVAGCGFGDNGVYVNNHHMCGDGVVDPGEGCDDGNTTAGDGCSADCAVEVANPVCGNSVREVGEACDDGNAAAGDGCSPTCAVESVCGNGTREAGEACDDGNVASGDGCSPTCEVEASTACSLVPQGGCAASSACDVLDDGSTECRAVTAQGTSNDHCTADTACKAGYTCLEDAPGETPWCSKFCITDSDCFGTGARCLIGLTDTAGNDINVDVCTNACNPVSQNGCPSGTGCVIAGATAGAYTDCRNMGTKGPGQTCTSNADCAPGNGCVNVGGTKLCRKFCDVGDDTTCPGSQVCGAFISPLMYGTAEIGACQ